MWFFDLSFLMQAPFAAISEICSCAKKKLFCSLFLLLGFWGCRMKCFCPLFSFAVNRIKIFALFVCVICCACTSEALNGSPRITDAAVTPISEMTSPSTAMEFLQNIKLAVENGAFYGAKTYRDERSVAQIFSGRIIKSSGTEDPPRGVYISDFPASIDPTQEGKIIGKQKYFQKSLGVVADQFKGRVIVRVNYIAPIGLTLTDVQKLFGQKGEYSPPPRMEPFDKPVAPLWYYRFGLAAPETSESYLIAVINSAQQLTEMTIYLQKEQP